MKLYLLVGVICLLGLGFTNEYLNVPVGTQDFKWNRASPESVGLSADKLEELRGDLEQRGTKKFMVIKNDRIVFEWFAEGWHDSVRSHYTASMAKALVGGMSLLSALDRGLLSPDMPACLLIPEWKSHPKKSKITIRQLATHTSGLDDAEVSTQLQKILEADGVDSHKGLPGWKGQFWRQDTDPFLVSRDSTEVLFVPGSHFNYSNPGIGMLSYAVTASLQGQNNNIRTLLWDRVYAPLGIKEHEISIGYRKTYELSGLQLVPSWGGGGATAEAVARIARLMLHKGNWLDNQLFDSTTVDQVLAYFGTAIAGNNEELVSESSSLRHSSNPLPATTMGWYTNFDKVWNHVPADAFAAAGAGHQLLLVVPSLDIIVVRFGDDLSGDRSDGFWWDAEKYLFNPIMDAVVEEPYPHSSDITGSQFAPESETIRLAEGSDNWPTSWADDNNLYTAYGDGWGG